MWRLVHQWSFLCCFDCVSTVFDDWHTVGTVLKDLWRLVHQWSFCCFGCFWRLVHCWYCLGRHVTIGTPMIIFPVLTVFWRLVHRWHTIGTVLVDLWRLVHQFNGFEYFWRSLKTVKRQSNSKKWPLVYQSSHIYTESAEYTKPRERHYLAKPPSHVPAQWPQPVARGQGWLYVSTVYTHVGCL